MNIATRTHRADSSSNSTTTEQVPTLHNATAYVEGIHFGSCFRQVNTHAPLTFLSFEIQLKIHQKRDRKKNRFIRDLQVFRFLLFSSFATSSTLSSSSSFLAPYLFDCKLKSKSVPIWTCDDKVVPSRTESKKKKKIRIK